MENYYLFIWGQVSFRLPATPPPLLMKIFLTLFPFYFQFRWIMIIWKQIKERTMKRRWNDAAVPWFCRGNARAFVRLVCRKSFRAPAAAYFGVDFLQRLISCAYRHHPWIRFSGDRSVCQAERCAGNLFYSSCFRAGRFLPVLPQNFT